MRRSPVLVLVGAIALLAAGVAAGATGWATARPSARDAVVLAAVLAVAVGLVLLAGAAFALRRGRSQAVHAETTDALTGLRNRRGLELDLSRQAGAAGWHDPAVLVLSDLNGFKTYNDTFGRVAGDMLLARFGRSLAAAVAGRGTAYRVGGDEFAVLARPGRAGVAEVVEATGGALTERGDGFAISAACGSIVLPDEATVADEALRLADLRLYEAKTGRGVPVDLQTINVLLRALYERDPDLAQRFAHTTRLADGVCRRLGLSEAERAAIGQAAQVHDIGKVAVPDGILTKSGPLDDEEWTFLRQTPAVGERIATATTALSPLAPMIRACREWFDGTGYPDGLAGEAIPLGARVISACSAVAAMSATRPYAAAWDLLRVTVELRRLAGAQFDPRVVSVLLEELSEATSARVAAAEG
jgi:two-component system, cell cycle response regulator